jgi:hypothetical protein
MKIQIEATDTITTIDGVPVRLWRGWTENGIACAVMVHRIAVLHSEDATEFDSQLKEQLPPGNSMPFYDALAQWREQLPHIPFRGQPEHPEGHDGPCMCDSCVEDGIR